MVGRAYESSWSRALELIGAFYWRSKIKKKKGTIVRKPKLIKAVMLFYSNYDTNRETRNSVSSLVVTLGGIPIKFLLKPQITITLIITKEEYV